MTGGGQVESIAVYCNNCPWYRTSSSGTGMLAALKQHESYCHQQPPRPPRPRQRI